MEEDNIYVDDEGHLDVRYRGWTQPDPNLFTLSAKIVSLDISFNQLQTLPDEIGSLRRMKIFNCSCNRLEVIPPTIGNLRVIRELKANGNKLKSLPREIGKCSRLSTMILSENNLAHLPSSIEHCISLKVLELQNNKLKSLPLSLANLKDTLQKIDVRNNQGLSIIPRKLHGNSFVIMWIISFLNEKTSLLERINSSTMDMSILTRTNKDIMVNYREQMENIHRERRVLVKERLSVKYYLVIRKWLHWLIMRLHELQLFCKEMLIRRRP